MNLNTFLNSSFHIANYSKATVQTTALQSLQYPVASQMQWGGGGLNGLIKMFIGRGLSWDSFWHF